MSDELRPCPFCGGAAHASLAAYASGATAHALCDGCGAAVLGYGRGERGLRDALLEEVKELEKCAYYFGLDFDEDEPLRDRLKEASEAFAESARRIREACGEVVA